MTDEHRKQHLEKVRYQYHLVHKSSFNIVEEWFATNWSGVCGQLSKVTIPTLVVTGAEDVAVPAANSLIIVQKIPGAWLVQIRSWTWTYVSVPRQTQRSVTNISYNNYDTI